MTTIRKMGDRNKHAPPLIDETALLQIRQKLAEKRRQGTTFDKKKVHQCLRNYEDKLVIS